MTTFAFAPDMSRVSPGTAWTLAPQKQVYTAPCITGNYNGQEGKQAPWNGLMKVAAGGRNGNLIEYYYPKGSYGESTHLPNWGTESFHVTFLPAAEIVVEYLWTFVPPFDLSVQGKICPAIDNGSARLRIMWNSNYAPRATQSKFRLYVGNKDTGTQVPNAYTPWFIVPGQTYHVAMHFAAGPQGSCLIQIDGVEYFKYGPLPASGIYGTTAVTNSWTLDFGSFFGGGGSAQAAKFDCRSHCELLSVRSSAAVLPVAVSHTPSLGSTGVLTVDFLDAAGAAIPPPSQYSFTSNDPAIKVTPPVALNAAPLLPAGTPALPAVTITVACPGITNGTAQVMTNVQSKVVLA